jgi:hypothetical protein
MYVCTFRRTSNTHEGNRNHAESYDHDLLLSGGRFLLPIPLGVIAKLTVSNTILNSIRSATVDDVFAREFAC